MRYAVSHPLRLAIFLASFASAFAQQPLVYSRSIFNAASYMPAGIPAGAIAQGSVFTLFGANLGPATAVTANSFPLSNNLGGVTITVTQGSNTVNAIPVYVSASQINAIMPSNAPLGTASLRVLFNNAPSNFTPVRIANTAFGIFTALGTGLGPGVVQNFVSQTNQPINEPKITAQPGQTITLWGTGLGPVPYPDNQAIDSASRPPVTMNVCQNIPPKLWNEWMRPFHSALSRKNAKNGVASGCVRS